MKMRAWFLLSMGMLMIGPQSVWAQERAYPVISVKCDVENDELKIGNQVKWDKEGETFPFSAEQGTYNPWSWVKIDAAKSMTATGQVELSCQLSSNIYTLVLKPWLFNTHFDGKCGHRISAVVTVFRGGSMIVDNKPMEEFCLGNAPVIRGIKVFGKSGQVRYFKIPKHKFL